MAKKEKREKKEKKKKKQREEVVVIRPPKVKMAFWEVLVAIVASGFLVFSLICAGMAVRSAVKYGTGVTPRAAAAQDAAEEAPAILFEDPDAPPTESLSSEPRPSAETAWPGEGVSTGLTAPGAQDWTVMVWITDGGRTYHSRSDCEDVGSGSPRQVMIQEATALDYFRCEKCW